jgi:hypothetical protein
MALPTQSKIPYSNGGPYWPMGMIVNPVAGNKTRLTSLVDPSNNNAPETSNAPGSAAANNALAYTPTVHKLFFQGYHPANNNNGPGLIPNLGNVYVSIAPSGSAGGNNGDYGAMVMIVPPGGGGTWPGQELEADTVNPYALYMDTDNNNDGLLVVGQL